MELVDVSSEIKKLRDNGEVEGFGGTIFNGEGDEGNTEAIFEGDVDEVTMCD
jgi:hypothetical protein